MKENKEANISYFTAHLTTIISVSLVLIIVGVIALISIGAANGGREIKQQIELNAVLGDSVTDSQGAEIAKKIKTKPYALSARLITKREAMKIWQRETGENLEDVFGVNPLSPEVSFSLKAGYTHPDSIKKICAELSAHPEIEGVVAPDSEMITAMNENIESLNIVLSVIAIALLVISFVLINNTVHLSIYSRRFSIHTMQLVGATNGFVRRPFIIDNLLSGVIAATIASAILAGVIRYIEFYEFPELTTYIDWCSAGIVFVGLLVFGSLICSVAAFVATSRYLHKKYDELFK